MNACVNIVEQSLQHLADGQPALALGLVDPSLAAEPGRQDLLFIKAEALRLIGDFGQSERLFLEVLQAGGGIEAYYRLGMAQFGQGKWQDAERHLALAAELNPAHAMAWFYLGWTRLLLDQPAGAEPACRRAVELNPDLPQAWSNLAACLTRLGQPGAAEAMTRVWEFEPDQPEIARALVQSYIDDKRFDDAARVTLTMARLHPQDPWWVGAVFGWLHRATGQDPLAVEAYRRAVVLAPNDSAYQSSLGLAMRQAKMPDAAAPVLKRAIQLDPGSVEANIGLAGVSLDKGEFGQVLRSLQEFEARSPDFRTAKRSVVIPVLDYSPGSPYNIRTLLDDLAGFDGEVICIFNGDEVYRDLQSHPRINKFSYNKQNVGVARAWNMGINQAEGETIHILNADLKISVAMLYRLEQWLHHLPNALCVGVTAHWFDFVTQKETGNRMAGTFSQAIEADMLSGQLFSLHAARLHDAGISFDPRLSPYFSEEIDLGLKARRAGYKMYAVPETDYEHTWGISRRDRPIYYFGRPVHRLRCLVHNLALVGQKAVEMQKASVKPAKKRKP